MKYTPMQLKTAITPEEYLALERKADVKSEYFNGELFVISGASRKHNQISTNLVRILGNELLDEPCNVYASDMKVKIEKFNKYSYPDIVVACEEEKFEDEQEDVLLNPLIIIEILSDSTKACDRGQKFFHYQSIDSFVEYILVSQKSSQIEKFVRQTDNTWNYSVFHNTEDLVHISSIKCDLPIKEVYRKVSFKG